MIKSLFSLSLFPIMLGLLAFGCHTGVVFAQATPGGQETRKNSGNQDTFSYRIQTTYGATTSAQVSGNMKADTEAVLKLKSGTKITNKMGDQNGNASAVYMATPNGGNVELKGITGENIFLIDEGTMFRATLTTTEGGDPSVTSIGSASATATHATTVIVEKGSSTYENVFQQTF